MESENMSIDVWHYVRNGEQQGPCSLSELKRLVAEGKLTADDLIWKEGLPDWVEARSIQGLIPTPKTPPLPKKSAIPPSVPLVQSGEGAKPATSEKKFVPLLRITKISNGHLSAVGSYEQIFSLTEEALSDCGAKIKERDAGKGLLSGKCRYGINPFGMTVTANLYATAEVVRIEISAQFTDALDTWGACDKKVSAITEKLIDLSKTAASSEETIAYSSGIKPPTEQNRAGVSYKRKAIVGLVFSLIGLLAGPLSLLGVIFSVKALKGIKSSNNKDGKGAAISGVVIGAIALISWAVLCQRYFRNTDFPSAVTETVRSKSATSANSDSHGDWEQYFSLPGDQRVTAISNNLIGTWSSSIRQGGNRVWWRITFNADHGILWEQCSTYGEASERKWTVKWEPHWKSLIENRRADGKIYYSFMLSPGAGYQDFDSDGHGSDGLRIDRTLGLYAASVESKEEPLAIFHTGTQLTCEGISD